MRTGYGRWLLLGLFPVVGLPATAAEIVARPGKGTISAVAKKAKKGDVIKLGAGKYRDSVRLRAGVALVGAGADKTELLGTDFAAVHCGGAEVRVSGIRFRPGEKAQRAIDSDHPIRVEFCRFDKFEEGVNLRGAPLSDVICCEFIDCNVGVRAYARASPTIWGCLFKGGGMGAGCLDGAPYVRNNLFRGQKTGLLLMTDEPAIVRNNVFWECSAEAIKLGKRKDVLAPASIRNNIMQACGAAAAGPADLMGGLSHCAVHGTNDPFRDDEGKAALNAGERHIVGIDPQLTLEKDGTLTIGGRADLKDKGIRLWQEPEGTVGPIGLTVEALRPGCRPLKIDAIPAIRFGGKELIVNSVGEEHDYVRYRKLTFGEQSLFSGQAHPLDVVQAKKGDKVTELRFDIGRFFGEMFLKP